MRWNKADYVSPTDAVALIFFETLVHPVHLFIRSKETKEKITKGQIYKRL